LGVDLLQGGRRESLAAGNSLIFAVEGRKAYLIQVILAAGTGLFPSEGYSGAPNFQYSDPTIKYHFRALSIEIWPCGKVWLSGQKRLEDAGSKRAKGMRDGGVAD
jgi:hypothetical protein